MISPEGEDVREVPVLTAMLAAGLERYHVRKPSWSRDMLAEWLQSLPERWRGKLVLHQHHDLVDEFKLCGRHWRDDGTALLEPPAISVAPFKGMDRSSPGVWASRSCHDLETLRSLLGRYDSILFGPVFPSISKLGYKPSGTLSLNELYQMLRHRTSYQKHTEVIALGGLTAATAPRCRNFGFDGVATLGAIWQSADPLRAFSEIQSAIDYHAT
ncbi:MAG: thiamine phosphate synthase [Nibricoccus sp.]